MPHHIYREHSSGEFYKWVGVREDSSSAKQEADRRSRVWGRRFGVIETDGAPDRIEELPETDEEEDFAEVYQQISGIGPALAEKLVEEVGSVYNVTEDTDLLSIPGVGEATRDKILNFHNGEDE